MSDSRGKVLYDEEPTEERKTKIKRHDIEVPTAEVDINLANKLDSILNIGGAPKPRFLTNKPKSSSENGSIDTIKLESDNLKNEKLKSRGLTKEELRKRLLSRYDTLVPDLDLKRPNVRVVKVLSATESIELGKIQAKKQIERQLLLASVSGNQKTQALGLKAFRFKDGDNQVEHQIQTTGIRSKIKDRSKESKTGTKCVKFDDNVSHRTFERRIEETEDTMSDSSDDKVNETSSSSEDEDEDVDSDDNYLEDDDDVSESDCSTTIAAD